MKIIIIIYTIECSGCLLLCAIPWTLYTYILYKGRLNNNNTFSVGIVQWRHENCNVPNEYQYVIFVFQLYTYCSVKTI